MSSIEILSALPLEGVVPAQSGPTERTHSWVSWSPKCFTWGAPGRAHLLSLYINNHKTMPSVCLLQSNLDLDSVLIMKEYSPATKRKAIKPIIRFDSDATSYLSDGSLRPVVFAGEQLVGTVVIDDGVDFDGVLVTLKGSIQNITKDAQSPARKIKKNLIRLSCTLNHSSFRGTGNHHEGPFFFSVPQCVTLPDPIKSFTFSVPKTLPPTIHEHKKRDPNRVCNDDNEGTCDIVYLISAQLILSGSHIDGACAERELIFFPTSEIPPPVFIPQYSQNRENNEYQLVTWTTLKTSFNSRLRGHAKVPRVQVEVPEPNAFVISPHQIQRDSSTQLNLQFSLTGGDMQNRPNLRECKVELSLRALTSFSIDEEIKKASDLFITKRTFRTEKRKLILEPWEWLNERWKTSAVIKTIAPEKVKSLPSFSCGIVSRRFVFVVQVTLSDAGGGGTNGKMELQVPVQVVLKNIEVGDNSDTLHGEVELPGYLAQT